MGVPRKSSGLGVLVAVSLAFAACTASATPVPTAAPTAASSLAPTATPITDGTLPKPEVTKINVGTSAASEMSQFSGVFANQLKLYDKYGLTSTFSAFEGDAKAVGALQAGQIDMAFTGVASAVSSQLTDVPYVVIGINATSVTDDLICQKAIKTGADVKGKKIAISTFGGSAHGSALLALKALKLTATDVTITQVGGESTRVAALKGGSIDCAVTDKVLAPDLVTAGFNVVVELWKPPVVPFGRSGVGVTKDYLKKNPNTVLVALAAVLEAQNMIWTQPALAATDFATWGQIDAKSATDQVTDFLTVGNRSMLWSDDAINNAKKIIATVNPDIIDVPVTSAEDHSLLQKLLDIGFYKKIGNPATTP